MQFNGQAVYQYLDSHWPKGLQNTLVNSIVNKIPIRYFIVDNSGSMCENDGHILTYDSKNNKALPKNKQCSRWKELTDSIRFHAGLARAGNFLSEFRLLNNTPPCMVGNNDDTGYQILMNALNGEPSGGTPLCHHINEIVRLIQGMEQDLRNNGHQAAIIICTDGESSDGNIVNALKPLERLPCYVVIRLCTDDEKIVNYWNEIDNQLELQLDVLNDFEGTFHYT